MFKKILRYTGLTFLFILAVAYFVFAGSLYEQGRKREKCKSIKVTIADMDENRFVTEDEVLDILGKEADKLTGTRIDSINLFSLEGLLRDRSAIKHSEASINRAGELHIVITQRRPIIRLQYQDKGFYIDETDYIFPLVKTFASYVPVVSGNMPVDIKKGFRGRLSGKDSAWVRNMTDLATYINRNSFWNAQIQQLYFDKNSDIILFPRVGGFKIIFGGFDDIAEKFMKLEAFYDEIAPAEGWKKYHTINLKYKNQIICE